MGDNGSVEICFLADIAERIDIQETGDHDCGAGLFDHLAIQPDARCATKPVRGLHLPFAGVLGEIRRPIARPCRIATAGDEGKGGDEEKEDLGRVHSSRRFGYPKRFSTIRLALGKRFVNLGIRYTCQPRLSSGTASRI